MVTLAANKFIGALTNLIAVVEVNSTLDQGKMTDLIEVCRNRDVPNGDGKLIITADTLSVTDLPTTSTLLSVAKPTLNEEYLQVDKFKTIQLTINKWLMRGAFIDEYSMSTLVGYLFHVMEETRTIYLYQELVNTISTYMTSSDIQGSQVISIPIYNTSASGITVDEKLLQQRYNAEELFKVLMTNSTNIALPNKLYNELGYTQVVDIDDMVVLLDSSVQSQLTTNALATLLNSQKISDVAIGRVLVADIQTGADGINNTSKVFVFHREKFQYGYFYNVATSFFDASTLNENHWLHFSYYMGYTKGLPCYRVDFTNIGA